MFLRGSDPISEQIMLALYILNSIDSGYSASLPCIKPGLIIENVKDFREMYPAFSLKGKFFGWTKEGHLLADKKGKANFRKLTGKLIGVEFHK